MTSPNQTNQQRIAAAPHDAPSSPSLFDKPLFMMRDGARGASSSDTNETSRRIQELFGLLKDIQNDPRFLSRFGKEKAHTITDGIRQRLIATRNKSAALVFGFGKLGGNTDDKASGDDSSSKLLQQTLHDIEYDLLKLRHDMTVADSKSSQQSEPAVARVAASETSDAPGGKLTSARDVPSTIDTTAAFTASPASEGGCSAIRGANEESRIVSSGDCDTESSSGVSKQKTHVQIDRSGGDKPVTPLADEETAALLEKERKRVAHLLYLNKALEAKVQTVEAEKINLKKLLDEKPKIVVDSSTNQGAGDNKVLEEKLQRTVASLDLIKIEAANMHHEVLQLRKNEAAFSEEKALSAQKTAQVQSDLTRLQTLYNALEKQAQTLAEEKTQLKSNLEEERAMRAALKAHLGSVVHSKDDLSETFETKLSSQGMKLKTLSEELESSEEAVVALRKELERKGSEATSSVAELRRSNAELKKDLDARDQEIRKITKEIASQALMHAAELEHLSTKLQSREKTLTLLQEETRACEMKDEEIRALHDAVQARDQDIHELKAVVMNQAISMQSAKADNEALEIKLADVVTQQRKDLRAYEEALEAQTLMCTELKKESENLKKDLAITHVTSEQIHLMQEKLRIAQENHAQNVANLEERYRQEMDLQRSVFEAQSLKCTEVEQQCEKLQKQVAIGQATSDQTDHIVREKLRIEQEKHAQNISYLVEKYRKEINTQRTDFEEKEASMQRLLEDAQAHSSQFEAKLQKACAENARCLSLIVKMGKHQLGN